MRRDLLLWMILGRFYRPNGQGCDLRVYNGLGVQTPALGLAQKVGTRLGLTAL